MKRKYTERNQQQQQYNSNQNTRTRVFYSSAASIDNNTTTMEFSNNWHRRSSTNTMSSHTPSHASPASFLNHSRNGLLQESPSFSDNHTTPVRNSTHGTHPIYLSTASSGDLSSRHYASEDDMTYHFQIKEMRYLMAKMLLSTGGTGNSFWNHSSHQEEDTMQDEEHETPSGTNQDSNNNSGPLQHLYNLLSNNILPPHIIKSITLDPVLSKDTLFVNLKHLMMELDAYAELIMGERQMRESFMERATQQHDSASLYQNAFCQTMQAFAFAIQNQKQNLVQELFEFEKEAVEMVQREGSTEFVSRPSVMARNAFSNASSQNGNMPSDTFNPNSNPLEDFLFNDTAKDPSTQPQLLTEITVRQKFRHLFRHVEYLHSLMRRVLDRYQTLLSEAAEYNRMHPSESRADSFSTLAHYQLATFILNLLYDELLHYESLKSSESALSIYKMLLCLFMDTVPPYLDLLDHWLFNGDVSQDHYQEFIVSRSGNIRRMRGKGEYWKEFFKTRDENCIPRFLLASTDAKDSEDSSRSASAFSPISLMKQILLTGKSIHLMQYIEKENLLATIPEHEERYGDNGDFFHQQPSIVDVHQHLNTSQDLNQSLQHKDPEFKHIVHNSQERPSLQDALITSLLRYTSRNGALVGKTRSPSNGLDDERAQWEDSFSVFQSNPSSPIPVGSLRYHSPRSARESNRREEESDVTLDGDDDRMQDTVSDISKALDFSGEASSPVTTSKPKTTVLSSYPEQNLMATLNSMSFSSNAKTDPVAQSLYSFSDRMNACDMMQNFDSEPIDDLVQELSKPSLEEFLGLDSTKKDTTITSVIPESTDRSRTEGEFSTSGASLASYQVDQISDAFIPFRQLLNLSLYSHIREQYLRVSPYVVNLLFNHCKLMHHFIALRAIFLMESGDIMHYFSTQIFEAQDKNMRLMDEFNQLELNSILQESLQFGVEHPRVYEQESHFLADQAAEMEDSSEDEANRDTSGFDIFQSIRVQDRLKIIMAAQNRQNNDNAANWNISYEAEYPLNAIITTDSIEVYNDVLHLLMDISQAKYLLDRVRLPQRTRSNIRSAQLLLYQMRQFVNTLHEYIKTKVVQECWKDFISELSCATDVDCISEAHNEYLRQIQLKCLLKGPPPIFLKEIRNILSLSIVFCKKCATFREEYDKVTSAGMLQGGETFQDFSNTSRLCQRLNNIVTRLSSEFESHVRTLQGLLHRLMKRGIHPELKDLSMRLDFNGFYV